MTVRRPLGSSSRSSQAWYSQTAACSFERAVPPSPNMMQLYQTNVRVSILYLQIEPHNPAHHATNSASQAPPQHPLPSPSSPPSPTRRLLPASQAPPQLPLHSPSSPPSPT